MVDAELHRDQHGGGGRRQPDEVCAAGQDRDGQGQRERGALDDRLAVGE